MIDRGVVRAKTTLRKGDKLKVAGRGGQGQPAVYRFSHWDGDYVVSASGVDDIAVIDILSVNRIDIDFYGESELDKLQARNGAWLDKVNAVLGVEPDLPMRLRRFAEEAAELCQAAGLDEETFMHVARDAYSRPVGETGQEIGGVMVTLLCMANLTGHRVDAEARQELARIDTPEMIQKISDKQAVKAARGL